LTSTNPNQPTPAGRPLEVPEGVFGALGISSPKRIVLFFGCLIVALLFVLLVPVFDELQPGQRRALFILVFAALLWVSEAIAAFSVGILIIALNIGLLGNPRNRDFALVDRDWEQFVTVIGHPLVWLFFGGFVLAAGMRHTGLDRWIASRLLSRFGTRPSAVLFGIMAVTFMLSMFMSNTATTAMMIAMLGPLIAQLDRKLSAGLLIGTAVAANLGGMGSLIGTPPNAIAVGVLSGRPNAVDITFLDWMVIGFPLGAVLMLLTWAVISRLYMTDHDRLPPILSLKRAYRFVPRAQR
jgi:sodium-dependent dicarboxylate transporter 2/3/5